MSLALLKSYKQIIEEALTREFTQKNPLEKAMRYALLSDGKRIRPLLTLLVGEALGFGLPVLESALAVEFSHTASLIVDDLPCMDDEKTRRGKNCLHIEFGEATAILASYGLITAAFGKIEANGRAIRSESAYEATSIALSEAALLSGSLGATLGQQIDLFTKPDCEEGLERLIYLKTITLFEMAFLFGWVFGGGDLSKVKEVKKAAYHLGMAFQIRDDILDHEKDLHRGSFSNYAVLVGNERARERFYQECSSFSDMLDLLRIKSAPFEALLEIICI